MKLLVGESLNRSIRYSINSRTVRIDTKSVENELLKKKVNLVGGSAAWLWFLTEDCTGQIFMSTVQDTVHKIDTYYVTFVRIAKSYIVKYNWSLRPIATLGLW